MSASLSGRLGSSTFRLSITTVSMSLTGSCFSSESAPGPFHHGILPADIFTLRAPEDVIAALKKMWLRRHPCGTATAGHALECDSRELLKIREASRVYSGAELSRPRSAERRTRNVRFGSLGDIAPHKGMSALPQIADICSALADVRFGPIADIGTITAVQEVTRPRGGKST